jgi:hypothetical protein
LRGRLLADPRAARIVCGAALVAGGVTVTLPTVLALSHPAETPAAVLYVESGSKVVVESHDDRTRTISYAITTRYGGRRIEQGSLAVAPNQQVAVPLPSMPCATPIIVQTEELEPYWSRSVSLTILPEHGGRTQCGG